MKFFAWLFFSFKACSASSFFYEKVDQNARSQKRIIPVPSPASIEDMRTLITENNKSTENPLKLIQTESKIPRLAASPNRTPFADVNSVN